MSKKPFVMFAALVLAIVMTACSSVIDSVGVSPDDNAALCVRASVNGSFTNTRAAVTRIELPASMQGQAVTLDDLERTVRIICPPQ